MKTFINKFAQSIGIGIILLLFNPELLVLGSSIRENAYETIVVSLLVIIIILIVRKPKSRA
ncbi:hypothetical protein ACFPYN_03835 [Paenisporosarcina macmurdoensis]|uniref:Uncharacterized protein n=1 Tax=Paenisporosarcina macmurdoensis TaxID=212659 RepID=A0ABW1L3K9_9BACL